MLEGGRDFSGSRVIVIKAWPSPRSLTGIMTLVKGEGPVKSPAKPLTPHLLGTRNESCILCVMELIGSNR